MWASQMCVMARVWADVCECVDRGIELAAHSLRLSLTGSDAFIDPATAIHSSLSNSKAAAGRDQGGRNEGGG